MTATNAERATAASTDDSITWTGTAVTAAVPTIPMTGGVTSGELRMLSRSPREGGEVSHWDNDASPNLLMESLLENDVGYSLFPPADMTAPAMQDIGWTLQAQDGSCVAVAESPVVRIRALLAR